MDPTFALLLGMMPIEPACHPILGAAAPTALAPWVQVLNPCDDAVDLSDYVVRYTGSDYGFGATAMSGELGAGECLNLRKFWPPLQGGVGCADAIAIFPYTANALADTPLDAVVYGDEPCASFASLVDVPVVPRPWQHLQLGEDGWTIELGSDAPRCKPLMSELDIAAAEHDDPTLDGYSIPDPDLRHCLRIEEVFYAGDLGEQWIDIENLCGVDVPLQDLSVQYTAPVYEWAWGVQPLRYSSGLKVIPAFGCATMGGKQAPSPAIQRTFDPAIEIPLEASAEGIGLFVYGDALPFDAAIYGTANERSIPSPSGLVEAPNAPDVMLGHSLRRTADGWIDESIPAAGECG